MESMLRRLSIVSAFADACFFTLALSLQYLERNHLESFFHHFSRLRIFVVRQRSMHMSLQYSVIRVSAVAVLSGRVHCASAAFFLVFCVIQVAEQHHQEGHVIVQRHSAEGFRSLLLADGTEPAVISSVNSQIPLSFNSGLIYKHIPKHCSFCSPFSFYSTPLYRKLLHKCALSVECW